MTTPKNPIVVIPARMASTRLPDKPLADIAGDAMIVHVCRRAMEADCGPVVVACAEQVIADTIEAAGGKAVLTDPDHPSGSDRIYEAVEKFDPDGRFDVVINLQGDIPTIEKAAVRAVLDPLDDADIDIATLVTEITDAEERTNPNVVKAVVAFGAGDDIGRAIYFSRATVPWCDADDAPLFCHIGVYAYRREALRRFIELPPGVLEQRERLEQLRALENGMRIAAARVDTVPLGVDTPADLELARKVLSPD